jgi:thiamine pyrophosphate-dependent acetolactate synthase large subunit-like protein
VTTAVKYALPLTHIVLDNGELAKISREQLGAIRPVWETNLVNPDFAAYARDCGAAAFTVHDAGELRPKLEEALSIGDRPSLVHVHSSNRDV